MNITSPVRQLQEMLRALSKTYPQLPELTVDGVFGEQTLEAVMIFQRDLHPPVTGVVDTATWQAIESLYRSHQTMPRRTPPFLPIPDGAFPIQAGSKMPQLHLVQTMLDSLAAVLSDMEPTEQDGILHGSTQQNIRTLQKGSRLPVTGILDLKTWSVLTRLYRIFASQPSNPT